MAEGNNTGQLTLSRSRPRHSERAVEAFLVTCAILSVGVTTAIVVSLFGPSIQFFREIPLGSFLTGTTWTGVPRDGYFTVLPLVTGTMLIVFWSLLVAVPVGLACAVYLSEYAPRRVRKVVKPALEILAGIPTVAIGLFALFFLHPFLSNLLPFLSWVPPFSVGVAGVAVGLMIVPIIASVADDAMRAVPSGLREGAYALGSSRMHVAVRIVFPAAISGVIAGIVLSVARAVGETMVVLMAAGLQPNLDFTFTQSAQTMTSFIGLRATGDIPVGTIVYDTIFAVGSMLFLMTMALNLVAVRLVRRFREEYE